MFSTHESIYKHILNGSTSYTEQVLTPPSFGILGLTYHLRFDHIIIITHLHECKHFINQCRSCPTISLCLLKTQYYFNDPVIF